MNTTLKHGILLFASLALTVSMLSLPAGPVMGEEGVSAVSFGQPFPFVTQDFTAHDEAMSFFPRYFNFSLNEAVDIVDFSLWYALLSFFSVFFLMEALIFSLEFLKGIVWVKKD